MSRFLDIARRRPLLIGGSVIALALLIWLMMRGGGESAPAPQAAGSGIDTAIISANTALQMSQIEANTQSAAISASLAGALDQNKVVMRGLELENEAYKYGADTALALQNSAIGGNERLAALGASMALNQRANDTFLTLVTGGYTSDQQRWFGNSSWSEPSALEQAVELGYSVPTGYNTAQLISKMLGGPAPDPYAIGLSTGREDIKNKDTWSPEDAAYLAKYGGYRKNINYG